MIKLTPMLYTKYENVSRVEGFTQTLCIVITLVSGETFERFISEETIADYALPDGNAAGQYRADVFSMFNFNGQSRILSFKDIQANHGVSDYVPKDREEAMQCEVAKLIYEFGKAT
jgi:hypothetical protein